MKIVNVHTHEHSNTTFIVIDSAWTQATVTNHM